MSLTLSELQKLSVERDEAFGRCADWSLADWMQALVGEVGEAANLLKKVRRGDFTLNQIRKELAHELADIQTYLPLLAHYAGIDLEQAMVEKFNIVSARIDSPITIRRRHEWMPSRVGHGEAQCAHCLMTNREAAIIAPEFCL